ncbi:hypothetical protein WUBG_09307 [Wuchereria bancrofti]|uniref:Uncharacterized protein n=1 Tax=Wuchereria bancrofti TaxID=6293 RepID=J9ERS6_WUCBA|nr:hypothetical protein WUBG_09307 [Wuchereria bancrofti]VDM19588.1 unnamed protein product [Wuchereria bancrofti]
MPTTKAKEISSVYKINESLQLYSTDAPMMIIVKINHFQHVQGQRLFERTLMAKIQLPNVHLGTMLEIDAKDAVKFMPFIMEDKKLKRLVSPAKTVAAFAA